VAGLTKKGSRLQARSGLILLALIVGAALGSLCALHAPLVAPFVPLSALAVVVVGAWAYFHRRVE
jgi:H+/Cl- antiporter ClcA